MIRSTAIFTAITLVVLLYAMPLTAQDSRVPGFSK